MSNRHKTTQHRVQPGKTTTEVETCLATRVFPKIVITVFSFFRLVLVVVALGLDFRVSFVLVWVLETHVAASRSGGGEILW